METRLRWAGGAAFIGESSSGHTIVLDGPPEGGGRNLGPRPMEMLLLSMGACSTYDVVSILKKSRQVIHGCDVKISAKRAEEDPKIFTDIHLHFILSGDTLTAVRDRPREAPFSVSHSFAVFRSPSWCLPIRARADR